MLLPVVRAGYSESRTVVWFVRMLLKLSIHVEKFLAFLDSVILWIHLFSAVLFVGGSFFMWLAVMPASHLITEDESERTQIVGKIAKQFRRVTNATLVVLVLTGVYNASWYLPSVGRPLWHLRRKPAPDQDASRGRTPDLDLRAQCLLWEEDSAALGREEARRAAVAQEEEQGGIRCQPVAHGDNLVAGSDDADAALSVPSRLRDAYTQAGSEASGSAV